MDSRVLLAAAVTVLLCATPAGARAQQSVANGFPPGTLSTPLAIPGSIDLEFSPLDTGDVNEDGLPDLVAFGCVEFGGSPCSVALYLGTPGGDLSPAVLFEVQPLLFHTLLHPFLVDVDSDGDLDIVAVYNDDAVTHVLLGHGDGEFDPPILSGGGLSGLSTKPPMVVGDVDDDGFPDLVFGQYALDISHFVEWSRGRGDGTFEPAEPLVTARTPRHVLLADLNRDGITDLAFMDAEADGAPSAFVVVHLGLGGGAFAPGVSYPVGANHEGRLMAADADGDGDLDLYNQKADFGGVRILHGVGDGTFVFDLFVPTPNFEPESFVVADVDRDGVPDLIGLDGPVKLQRMGLDGPIGPVTTSAFPPGAVNTDPETAVADFDVDGHLDLVVTTEMQAVRFLNALAPIVDLGYGQSSAFGLPILSMVGTPAAGQFITGAVQIGTALPGLLFIGLSPELAHFHGGLLVPSLDLALPVLGGQTFQSAWPAGIPPATAIYVQAVLATGGGQTANSNAVVIIAE